MRLFLLANKALSSVLRLPVFARGAILGPILFSPFACLGFYTIFATALSKGQGEGYEAACWLFLLYGLPSSLLGADLSPTLSLFSQACALGILAWVNSAILGMLVALVIQLAFTWRKA